MLLVPDWLARTLLMAQAPSMWRDSLSQGAQRRTPPLLLRRRLGCAPAATEPKKSLRNDFINVYEHVRRLEALIESKNGGLCDLAAGCAQHGRCDDK